MNISTHTYRVLDALLPMFGYGHRLNRTAKEAGVSPHYIRLLIERGLVLKDSSLTKVYGLNRNNPIIRITGTGEELWEQLTPDDDDEQEE